jgi:predicted nucleic acid-binding protein
MVLVDTSVWVDHLREGDPGLRTLLNDGQVAMHPWIIGELACGNLSDRQRVLALFRSLPATVIASEDNAHRLLEDRKLAGIGIGWIDIHLLASSLLSSTQLWTRDRRLRSVAGQLGLSFD